MMSGSDNRGRRDAFQPPVPLEDRLWRHPSELGVYADTGPRVILRKRPAMSRVLVAAAMGLIGGSVIGIGALVASGSVGQNSTGSTVERIAAPIARTATVDELVVAEAALPSVASVRVRGPAGERTATGVVVRDDGMVLTNSDVLDAADDITVTLDDGTAYPATLVGRHRGTDLGVLDIEANGLPVAALPDARLDEAVAFGDSVVLVNAASAGDGPQVSEAVVSGPSTELPAEAIDPDGGQGGTPMYGMVEVRLEPDATTNPAGGVLLDGNGSVLGIVTARTDGGDAARYATPFDYARQVYRQLMDSGEINTADLAVAVEELDDATADALNVSGGVVVSPVAAPAPDGLAPGDVITAINGADVNDLNDSVTEVRRYQPGDEVDIAVVRDGAPVTVVTRLRGAPGVP